VSLLFVMYDVYYIQCYVCAMIHQSASIRERCCLHISKSLVKHSALFWVIIVAQE
jgi:hypothetical protein